MQTDDEQRRLPTNRELIRAFTLFFLTWGVLQLFWIARAILIVTFLAALFALPLARLATRMERHGVRRGLTAAATMFLIVGTLIGGLILLGPLLKRQLGDLQSKLPEAIEKIESVIGAPITPGGSQESQSQQTSGQAQGQAPQGQTPQRQGSQSQTAAGGRAAGAQQQQGGLQPPAQGAGPQQANARTSAGGGGQRGGGGTEGGGEGTVGALRGRFQEQIGSAISWLFPFVSKTLAALGGVVLVIFLAIYFASAPNTYLKGFLHLVPKRKRAETEKVAGELAENLNQWLIARLIAMVLIGIITTGALMLIGVKGAIALGLFAGIMEFIPFFGPIISAIPAIGIAFAESPTKAIWTIVAFLIIQQIEGNIVTPVLLKRRLSLPPALTVAAVAIFGAGFGVMGLLIAEPMLAIILLLTQRLWVEKTMHDHSVPRNNEDSR